MGICNPKPKQLSPETKPSHLPTPDVELAHVLFDAKPSPHTDPNSSPLQTDPKPVAQPPGFSSADWDNLALSQYPKETLLPNHGRLASQDDLDFTTLFGTPVAHHAQRAAGELELLRERFVRLPDGAVSVSSTKLGEGAFGTVYSGDYRGQPVAVKEFNPIADLALNKEEALQAFNWEISCLSTLHHPNLVRFYGAYIGKGDGALLPTRLYMVMELCHKQNLGERLRKNTLRTPVIPIPVNGNARRVSLLDKRRLSVVKPRKKLEDSYSLVAVLAEKLNSEELAAAAVATTTTAVEIDVPLQVVTGAA